MLHNLKTWPPFWEAVSRGIKNFEVRKGDRDFQVGDTLSLQEWDPATKTYTGREIFRTITYILGGGEFGIEKDYVVMGLK